MNFIENENGDQLLYACGPNPRRDQMKHYYWLALNGASCALCAVPMPTTLVVHPTPQLLLGFQTFEEAQEHQRFFLTASIPDCVQRQIELHKRAERGETVGISPPDPEPPTHGPTMWSLPGDDGEHGSLWRTRTAAKGSKQ